MVQKRTLTIMETSEEFMANRRDNTTSFWVAEHCSEKVLQELVSYEAGFEQYGTYIVRTFKEFGNVEEMAGYRECVENWEKGIVKDIKLSEIPLSFRFATHIAQALMTVKRIYMNDTHGTESMGLNFATKLLFQLVVNCGDILKNWEPGRVDKVIMFRMEKSKHLLFAEFLANIGFDVLVIKNQDAPEKRKPEPRVAPQTEFVARTDKDLQEKSYEELANLASSVVMIQIYNSEREIIGSGSGIMIARNGYILTNYHVIHGGTFFTVRIENHDKEYMVEKVVKYHQVLDLALLEIDEILTPIPLYDNRKPLVRGQKVIAIGSPLGLFNTVSDGIISGFREINEVDMIQFTAPISHGSSGGAVINLRGQLVGISTAGIDKGQNLNLAVSYECIYGFIKNFISS